MSPVLPPNASIAVTTTPLRDTGVPGAMASFWTIWMVTVPPLLPLPSPLLLPSELLLLSERQPRMASEDRARNVVKRIQTSPVVSRGRTSTGARVYTENAKRAMRRASQQIVNFSSLRRCVAAAVQPAPFTRVALRGRLAVEADELDERHRGRVALAGARLQDARVAALAR